MLNFGNFEVHSGKVGASSVSKIYLGSNLIFEYTSPPVGNIYDVSVGLNRNTTFKKSDYDVAIEVSEYNSFYNTYTPRVITGDVCSNSSSVVFGSFEENSIITNIYGISNIDNFVLGVHRYDGDTTGTIHSNKEIKVQPFVVGEAITLGNDVGSNVLIEYLHDMSLTIHTNLDNYSFYNIDRPFNCSFRTLKKGDFYNIAVNHRETVTNTFTVDIPSTENRETMLIYYKDNNGVKNYTYAKDFVYDNYYDNTNYITDFLCGYGDFFFTLELVAPSYYSPGTITGYFEIGTPYGYTGFVIPDNTYLSGGETLTRYSTSVSTKYLSDQNYLMYYEVKNSNPNLAYLYNVKFDPTTQKVTVYFSSVN